MKKYELTYLDMLVLCGVVFFDRRTELFFDFFGFSQIIAAARIHSASPNPPDSVIEFTSSGEFILSFRKSIIIFPTAMIDPILISCENSSSTT